MVYKPEVNLIPSQPGEARTPKMSERVRAKKKQMREDTIKAYRKIFFEISSEDLQVLINDSSQPAYIKGICKNAMIFMETGDNKIFETMAKVAGLRLGETVDDASGKVLKDFLIDTIAKNKELEDKVPKDVIELD